MSHHQAEITMLEKLAALYYNKGLELARRHFISDAVGELKKAVSFDQGGTAGWNLLGLCYYRLGQYRSAEYCWCESLKLKPGHNQADRYLKELSPLLKTLVPVMSGIQELTAKGRYKKAGHRLEKEIINTLDPAVAIFNYGGILKYLAGERGKASNLWKRALELDRSNRQAAGFLAEGVEPPGLLKKWFRYWFS